MSNKLDEFLKKMSEKNLLKINKGFAKGKISDIIKTASEMIVDEYGVDPLLATSILKNKVQEILSGKSSKKE